MKANFVVNSPVSVGTRSAQGDASLAEGRQAAAREFEAAFLAEMLSHTGLGDSLAARAGFGGEAMSSFLLQEYGTMIARQGGVGIARTIELQIERRSHGAEKD